MVLGVTHRAMAAGLGLVAAWVGHGSAIAAERVILTYGFLSMEIPIEQLDTLARTGESPGELGRLLRLTNQEPATLQQALTNPVPANPLVLDIVLRTPPGEWVLDRIGETIQPSSGVAGSRSALRSALIGAASNGEITLLEVMRVYPSPEIVVQGDRVAETYSEVFDLLEPFIKYRPRPNAPQNNES